MLEISDKRMDVGVPWERVIRLPQGIKTYRLRPTVLHNYLTSSRKHVWRVLEIWKYFADTPGWLTPFILRDNRLSLDTKEKEAALQGLYFDIFIPVPLLHHLHQWLTHNNFCPMVVF